MSNLLELYRSVNRQIQENELLGPRSTLSTDQILSLMQVQATCEQNQYLRDIAAHIAVLTGRVAENQEVMADVIIELSEHRKHLERIASSLERQQQAMNELLLSDEYYCVPKELEEELSHA